MTLELDLLLPGAPQDGEPLDLPPAPVDGTDLVLPSGPLGA